MENENAAFKIENVYPIYGEARTKYFLSVGQWSRQSSLHCDIRDQHVYLNVSRNNLNPSAAKLGLDYLFQKDNNPIALLSVCVNY